MQPIRPSSSFNEPIVVQTRCYLDAARWPHEQNTKKWMLWNYHKALATSSLPEHLQLNLIEDRPFQDSKCSRSVRHLVSDDSFQRLWLLLRPYDNSIASIFLCFVHAASAQHPNSI
jgi:hypothetical protein